MTTFICNTCGARAIFRMRQHRLALCKEHYLEWVVNQTQRMIEKYAMSTATSEFGSVTGGKLLGSVDVQGGWVRFAGSIHLGIDRGWHFPTLRKLIN